MKTKTAIPADLLDQLLANYSKPEDLTGDDGLFKHLKKALIERALGAELTEHLGYEKGDPAGRGSGNSRNGTSSKTLLSEDGEVEIFVPRDRAGTFEPQLIPKGQTRFDGFDDKILSLYARGMTVREIQGHLAEPPISARRRHRPSPLHLPDHGEMVLNDREGIRRRAPEDWTGAAPLIARKQIDRLNMGVELLTEIGSIECRSLASWRAASEGTGAPSPERVEGGAFRSGPPSRPSAPQARCDRRSSALQSALRLGCVTFAARGGSIRFRKGCWRRLGALPPPQVEPSAPAPQAASPPEGRPLRRALG